eukprot:scaffold120007_cov36-Cyclotella_meneghiniana.AAC.1
MPTALIRLLCSQNCLTAKTEPWTVEERESADSLRQHQNKEEAIEGQPVKWRKIAMTIIMVEE